MGKERQKLFVIEHVKIYVWLSLLLFFSFLCKPFFNCIYLKKMFDQKIDLKLKKKFE